jgi:hypothetical protein
VRDNNNLSRAESPLNKGVSEDDVRDEGFSDNTCPNDGHFLL